MKQEDVLRAIDILNLVFDQCNVMISKVFTQEMIHKDHDILRVKSIPNYRKLIVNLK